MSNRKVCPRAPPCFDISLFIPPPQSDVSRVSTTKHRSGMVEVESKEHTYPQGTSHFNYHRLEAQQDRAHVVQTTTSHSPDQIHGPSSIPAFSAARHRLVFVASYTSTDVPKKRTPRRSSLHRLEEQSFGRRKDDERVVKLDRDDDTRVAFRSFPPAPRPSMIAPILSILKHPRVQIA